MNLSRTKIIIFFLATGSLLWFLYPRGLFLAYLYEGGADLSRAEAYYLKLLERNPNDKKAVLRLNNLYERVGTPEKALPWLEKLLEHRPTDTEAAEAYLAHFESAGDEEGLYQARLKVARGYLAARRPLKKEALVHLNDAYLQATWARRYEEAYGILDDLIAASDNPADFLWERENLDRALKRTDAVIASLRERIRKDPADPAPRKELVAVFGAAGRWYEAWKESDEGARRFPRDSEFLEQRAAALAKLGRIEEWLVDVDKILSISGLPAKKRAAYASRKGYELLKRDRKSEALAIFRDLLARDPKDRSRWTEVVAVLESLGRWEETAAFLESYLKEFPDDALKRKHLTEILLYRLKDTARTDLYWARVSAARDADFALDVGHLFVEKRDRRGAVAWFKKSLGAFPGDRRFVAASAGLFAEGRDYAAAFSIWDDFLSLHPDDAGALAEAASLKALLGEGEAAVALYERLVAARPDAATAELVGRELLFLGEPRRALKHLNPLVAGGGGGESGGAWFWISEAEAYLGHVNSAREAARRAADLLAETRPESGESLRQWLKASARARYDGASVAAYRAARERFPRDADLAGDLIDIQFESGKIADAKNEVAAFRRQFPRERQRLRAFDLRLAFHRWDWAGAVALLRDILREKPSSRPYRRDLAEALVRSGRWREGIRELESAGPPEEASDRAEYGRRLAEWHDAYDFQGGGRYRFAKLGGESAHGFTAFFKAPLAPRWLLKAEGGAARHDSPLAGFTGTAATAGAQLAYHGLPRWTFEGGARFGSGNGRLTVAPLLEARYAPWADGEFRLGAAYRELRDDVPQAVAAGALRDRFEAAFAKTLFKRVTLAGEYRFERTSLAAGASATGHRVEPSASLLVLREPSIIVGYRYAFLNHSGDPLFFNALPLVRDSQAHYLTAHFAKEFGATLKLESHAFLGEDTERGLHAFEGDLFGVGARVTWRATRLLNLEASYDFGRETLSGLSGESHEAGVSLTAHWF